MFGGSDAENTQILCKENRISRIEEADRLFLSKGFKAGERAQLLCKHEDLSSVPSTHVKS